MGEKETRREISKQLAGEDTTLSRGMLECVQPGLRQQLLVNGPYY